MRHKEAASWQVNTYRVLLSRARFETVIFVPPGDAGDGTRPPAEFDRIAAFLAASGAAPLAEADEAGDSPALLLSG
nr:DNA/RNA helicase domain-containing protein [Acidocella sp. C78]